MTGEETLLNNQAWQSDLKKKLKETRPQHQHILLLELLEAGLAKEVMPRVSVLHPAVYASERRQKICRKVCFSCGLKDGVHVKASRTHSHQQRTTGTEVVLQWCLGV